MGWIKKRLPRKRWKRVLLYIASTLLMATAADMALVQYGRRITIAPDTTGITAPLTPNGMPDYVAALNAEFGRGVTPENNAAPLMMQIYGTADAPEEWREKVLPQLGLPVAGASSMIDPLPPWLMQENQTQADWDEETLVKGEPWKSMDHPRWATWLDQQEPMLAKVQLAAKREHYFVPKIPGRYFISIGEWQSSRGTMFEAGSANLMRCAGDGNWEEFQREALAAMKLGRLMTRSDTIVDYAMGIALNMRGTKAIIAAAKPGIMPATQARELLAIIEALQPSARPDPVYDHFVRWELLDDFCYGSLHGIERLDARLAWNRASEAAAGSDSPQVPEPSTSWSKRALGLIMPLNIDQAMRDVNERMDRLVHAMRLPTFAQRQAAWAISEHEWEQYSGTRSLLFTRQPAAAVMEMSGGFKSAGSILILEQRARTDEDMAKVALGLLIYRAQAGAYPEKLDALRAAGILRDVPLDGFSDKPFVYEKRGNGYVLYSVGEKNEGEKEITGALWRVVRVEQ